MATADPTTLQFAAIANSGGYFAPGPDEVFFEIEGRICHRDWRNQLEQLVQVGRKSGLLRASPRLVLKVPQVELSCYQLAPPDLPRQRPGRAPAAPRRRAPKPATRVCGRPGCCGRGDRHPNKPRRSERPKPNQLSCQQESPDPLFM
jgi:hypothetical protein